MDSMGDAANLHHSIVKRTSFNSGDGMDEISEIQPAETDVKEAETSEKKDFDIESQHHESISAAQEIQTVEDAKLARRLAEENEYVSNIMNALPLPLLPLLRSHPVSQSYHRRHIV